ncbi:hypothetical protein [Acinetobacter johnsonii]|uniref:Uncharacterized protein n=1 Tax=Acinetobacter johnsonii TaxID=40214 RepID=A0AAJ6IIA2_ACIJO|nr:hypothetical protein [Acinetobacter johnsonii]WMG20087.1 hypothetical protein QBJ73_19075 [Acinetobacter johnsonii]
MQVKRDIPIALGLTVILTIIYYFIYAFLALNMKEWCDKNICFEFPPYADVLAIWVAIIGLYFVVTSLDDWKNQLKINNAIENYKTLYDVYVKIEEIFILLNIHEVEYKNLDPESDYADAIKANYLERFNKINAFELSNKVDVNLYVTANQYQNDLEDANGLSRKILFSLDTDLKELKLTSTKDFEYMYIKYRNDYSKLGSDLHKLNKKIKSHFQ